MNEGRVMMDGPRDEILKKLSGKQQSGGEQSDNFMSVNRIRNKEHICLTVCGPQGYDRKNGTE